MHRGHDHDHHGGGHDGHNHAHAGNGHARHGHDHGPGHNHGGPDLHSHPRGGEADRREGLQALAEAFIDGFRRAEDKASYLRLAGVPSAVDGPDGLAQRLVDVTIATGYQVATASPGFGSRDLVYLPFPGSMVRERTRLTFVYVSLTGRRDVDLVDFLAGRFAGAAD